MRECGVPVTDVQSKANCDWLLSAILSTDLWLIKRGEVAGSAERLHELLVFVLPANGGDGSTAASQIN